MNNKRLSNEITDTAEGTRMMERAKAEARREALGFESRCKMMIERTKMEQAAKTAKTKAINE